MATSDLQHLFSDPAKDPGHLTWPQFEAKQLGNLQKANAALPALVRPFVAQAEQAIAPLASVIIAHGGTALGAVVGTLAQDLEAVLAKGFASAGVVAATPAGQAAIAQLNAAAQATIANVTANAASGVLVIAQVPAPVAPAQGSGS